MDDSEKFTTLSILWQVSQEKLKKEKVASQKMYQIILTTNLANATSESLEKYIKNGTQKITPPLSRYSADTAKKPKRKPKTKKMMPSKPLIDIQQVIKQSEEKKLQSTLVEVKPKPQAVKTEGMRKLFKNLITKCGDLITQKL
ncbi:hypothetical protein HK103_002971 [Boothiomyces macroporosus]|uniref:Uncharacterized protein n=1 Tax=Boothiomyces macroporosus TaxID=261099 RepID=A0AAD5ULE0_9FUNG|nr:hypothetical protein HK103_002971 [Boothiomyces macroporosus]